MSNLGTGAGVQSLGAKKNKLEQILLQPAIGDVAKTNDISKLCEEAPDLVSLQCDFKIEEKAENSYFTNVSEPVRMTALHYLIFCGATPEVIKSFVKTHEAIIVDNPTFGWNNNPLHFACKFCIDASPGVVAYLVEIFPQQALEPIRKIPTLGRNKELVFECGELPIFPLLRRRNNIVDVKALLQVMHTSGYYEKNVLSKLKTLCEVLLSGPSEPEVIKHVFGKVNPSSLQLANISTIRGMGLMGPSNNNITPLSTEKARAVSDFIGTGSNLSTLHVDLPGRQLGSNDLRMILEASKSSKIIKDLSVTLNPGQHELLAELQEIVVSMPSRLEKLSLKVNFISLDRDYTRGAEALIELDFTEGVEALMSSSKHDVKELSIEGCIVKAEPFLKALLKDNSTLQRVNIKKLEIYKPNLSDYNPRDYSNHLKQAEAAAMEKMEEFLRNKNFILQHINICSSGESTKLTNWKIEYYLRLNRIGRAAASSPKTTLSEFVEILTNISDQDGSQDQHDQISPRGSELPDQDATHFGIAPAIPATTAYMGFGSAPAIPAFGFQDVPTFNFGVGGQEDRGVDQRQYEKDDKKVVCPVQYELLRVAPGLWCNNPTSH